MSDYKKELRDRILKKLEDLTDKIQNNVPCPEKGQDIDLLVDISDNIEACLNNWNY